MISVLLPSLRPELVKQRIEDFSTSTIDYELVIVSPFVVEGKNVKWVKESPFCKGSVAATNYALNYSSKDYVVYFSDDVRPTSQCLETMYKFMEEKRKEVTPFLGAFKMLLGNREIGPFGAYEKLYACYGCIHKKDIEEIGFFSSEFVYSWADIDLSLRVWEKGGKVEICQDAIVKPEQIEDIIYKSHRKLYWQKDVDTFLKKWHGKLGMGIERRDGAVNKRLFL